MTTFPTYEQQVAERRSERLGLTHRRKYTGQPLNPEAAYAVRELAATPCPDRRHTTHLIPKDATVCMWCGTDALDLIRLDYQ